MNKYSDILQLTYLFHAKTCKCRCMHCKGRGGGGQWGDNPFETVTFQQALEATRPIYEWYEAQEQKPFKLLLGASEVADYPDSEKLMKMHTRIYGRTFLVCNGMDFMSPDKLDRFFADMYDAGGRVCMTTFFGTEEFHDRFAGRKGDFKYLLDINRAAEKAGFNKMHVLFISRPTMPYLDELTAMLSSRPGKKYIQYRPIFNKPDAFTPEEDRLHKWEFEEAEKKYDLSKFWPMKTRQEWNRYILSDEYKDTTHDMHHLTPQIYLSKKTIQDLNDMTDIDTYLETVISKHRSLRLNTPTMKELCDAYGEPQPENDRMYTFCDLEYEWKFKYQQEHNNAPVYYL